MDNNLFDLPPQGDVSRSKVSGKIISNVYEVTKGGFGRDEDNIIAYSGSLKVSELVEDFEFFETLSRSKNWPISKIIQREIDSERVKNIEEGYIRSSRKVKYFPPIVVAILPKENDQLADAFCYDEDTESVDSAKRKIFEKSIFQTINSEFYSNVFLKAKNCAEASGLYVLELFSNSNYFTLSWDTEKYFAIAIDGQHRMSALIESYKNDKSIANYKQDVIFLDLSIKSKHEPSLTPVNIVRSIFIDINKNPRQVNRSRQILMDDMDTTALLVQTIVNDDDEDGTRVGKYLQPQIIDWYSEDQKFELPYCTSIINLWEIFNSELLSGVLLSSLDDFKNVKKVTAWKDQIDNLFKVDSYIEEIQSFNTITKISESFKIFKQRIASDGDATEEGTEDNEFEYFNFDYDVLRVIAYSFEKTFTSSIVKFFNDNSLYKNLINALTNEGAFDKEKTISHSLTISKSKRTEDQNTQFEKVKKTISSSLGSDYYYLYTVLGQKALFKYYFKGLIGQIGNVVEENNCLTITEVILSEFNQMFEHIDKNSYKLFCSTDLNNNYYVEFVKTYVTENSLDNRVIQLERSFWNDLIIVNNQIFYKQRGIETLFNIIKSLVNQVKLNIKENKHNEQLSDLTSLSSIGYFTGRVKKRIELETKTQQLTQTEIDALTNACIEVKTKFLDSLIKLPLSINTD